MAMTHLTRRDLFGLGGAAAAAVLLPTVAQGHEQAAGQAGAKVATPWQTEGPFFPIHEQLDKDADMTLIEGHTEAAIGDVVTVSGRILDTDGAPVADALIDIWQANHHGRYAHEADPNPASLDPHFQGWTQLKTGGDGAYKLRTIRPGAYPAASGWVRPPHLHFKVARRGFHEITTQLYFKGDPLNDTDRLLLAVPELARASLIADFTEGAGVFDIVLARV